MEGARTEERSEAAAEMVIGTGRRREPGGERSRQRAEDLEPNGRGNAITTAEDERLRGCEMSHTERCIAYCTIFSPGIELPEAASNFSEESGDIGPGPHY